MSTLDSRCLDAFPEWLRGLPDDARALAGVLDDEGVSEGTKRRVAGALNYLFKSLDLIPDGIEDLGFVDDAFVFRVSCALAAKSDPEAATADNSGTVARLSADAELVQEFLGDLHGRMESYATTLEQATARGRAVDDIIGDASVRGQLLSDVKGWAESYEAPAFSRDEKNLVKLRSFLGAKLPA